MPTFETALSASDWGAYNYGVLILCGLCALAEAAIAFSGPITLPLAKCDLRLTDNNMLWMVSIASLGMAVGGYVIGSLSDVSGRKCVIPFSMLIMFTGGIGSSFSSSFHMMLVCILIMGIGMGSHSFATRIFLAEILPKEKRGPLLVTLEVFWDLGVLIIGSLAWVLLPSALLYAMENFRPNSWRVMLAMCSCLSIIVACLTGILNPSPRYLLVKQKYNAAIDVFRQMFAINTSSHVDSYQIPDMTYCVEEDPEPDIEGTLCTEYVLNALKRMHTLTRKIFKKKYRKQTLLCIIIQLALFPGLIMSILWMREVMNWPGSYYFSGLESSWHCNTTGKLLLLPDDCADTMPSIYVYLDFVILASSMLVADILLIFLIDRAGHKLSLVVAFIGASLCSSVLPFNMPSIARIVVCCLFIASYTAATSAFTVITIEIFPTPIRGTANGLIPMLSRLLCMLVKLFVHTTCDIPLFVMAGLTFVAAALSWFLPDLTRKPMQEGVSQPQEL